MRAARISTKKGKTLSPIDQGAFLTHVCDTARASTGFARKTDRTRDFYRGNVSINRWIVQLLDIQPSDHVLEVGCGPGLAIQGCAAHAIQGLVVGIDASALMVHEARRRNAAAIETGRVEIQQGDASALPSTDASFDKVAATHVIYFWVDVVATLRELRRVLRPGGTVAIGFQIEEYMPLVAQQGFAQTGATLYPSAEDVTTLLEASGFTHIRVEMQGVSSRPSGFCVLGQREG